MPYSSVLDSEDVATSLGATDVLVYRRASGGRFVLTGRAPHGVSGELLLDDEPLACQALETGVRRVAGESPVAVCGGYRACAAAVIAIDRDVIVVLGRRDGCLAGVSNGMLAGAAVSAAAAQIVGVE